MKPRLTKYRQSILERMKDVPLAWGYTPHGGKEYFFVDGLSPSQGVIERMIANGILRYRDGPLGVGQEIVCNIQVEV